MCRTIHHKWKLSAEHFPIYNVWFVCLFVLLTLHMKPIRNVLGVLITRVVRGIDYGFNNLLITCWLKGVLSTCVRFKKKNNLRSIWSNKCIQRNISQYFHVCTRNIRNILYFNCRRKYLRFDYSSIGIVLLYSPPNAVMRKLFSNKL